MKKSILNKILAAAITYATPLVIDYIAKKFFKKKNRNLNHNAFIQLNQIYCSFLELTISVFSII
jgi:hypothetical protein